MNLPKSIRLSLAVVVVLILSYVTIFAKTTTIVYRAKAEAAKNPALSIIPVPLPDTSVSRQEGKTESFFGFEFETPWKDAEVYRRDLSAMIFSQSRGESVTFFDPAGGHGLLSTMKETPGLRPEYIYSLYGQENAKSDYELARAALSASPLELSLVMPWTKQVYAANLLWMKEAYIGVPTNEIYSFELGDLRGFEHGDPERPEVVVDAYDDQDHKFTFIFSGAPGPQGGLKQADINRVLQTFHSVADDD